MKARVARREREALFNGGAGDIQTVGALANARKVSECSDIVRMCGKSLAKSRNRAVNIVQLK